MTQVCISVRNECVVTQVQMPRGSNIERSSICARRHSEAGVIACWPLFVYACVDAWSSRCQLMHERRTQVLSRGRHAYTPGNACIAASAVHEEPKKARQKRKRIWNHFSRGAYIITSVNEVRQLPLPAVLASSKLTRSEIVAGGDGCIRCNRFKIRGHLKEVDVGRCHRASRGSRKTVGRTARSSTLNTPPR